MTNGAAERFNWTLKEQAIAGMVFRNPGEVRAAAAAFMESRNERWLIHKPGHRSPAHTRRDFYTAKTA
jgi:hypothetical protein